MNINELQTGNYVFDINNDIKCQVNIKDFRNGGEYILDYYEPIPITEEFFEKNGFELVEPCDNFPYIVYDSKDKRIQVSNLTNNREEYWSVHVDNEDFDTIGRCDVKYVHQFQQLLRLCGYEMDVVV